MSDNLLVKKCTYLLTFLQWRYSPNRDADHSPPSSAEVVTSRSYISSPTAPPQVCCWTAFPLLSYETLITTTASQHIRPKHKLFYYDILYNFPKPLFL
jgi:hypothetical protein